MPPPATILRYPDTGASLDIMGIDRRGFLRLAGSACLLLPGGAGATGWRSTGDPFPLGVASGDPLSDGFLLWTRLAPDPLHGGGMGSQAVPVDFAVATDESMRRVVRRGTALATAELGHSLHVEVRGLEPNRWYWYRFSTGGFRSPLGRTRTLPARGTTTGSMRLAVVSCQNFGRGFFTAYRHIREDNPDLVLHLGDYLYETNYGRAVREQLPEAYTLEDYRNLYAQYRSDPDLRAAHAACPWLAIWDDHEVDNDYAGENPAYTVSRKAFLRRRAAAYQAWYEHMPVRLRPGDHPGGGSLRIYRSLQFGDLAGIHALDCRQYRDDQACGTKKKRGGQVIRNCAARLDPKRTMLGDRQERWLLNGLGSGTTRWNVIAQALMMAKLDQHPGSGEAFWSDGWDGYPAARARLLAFIRERPVANPVVLSGDIHSFWVNDLKADFDDPASATIGTEFVTTSVSAHGADFFRKFLPDNPHVQFFEHAYRGYLRCDLDHRRWRTELRAVRSITRPASDVFTLKSFEVEAGRPGAVEA
ncbi:MAG: alkaline phosphatase D family protein [Gammaproteobacteria bacterium]|nr:alkaline phosphatase D family protein [Gammaproteobacteria bacterium]